MSLAVPAFSIEGGLVLALGRAISVAGLIAAFGSLLYAAWVVPRDLSPDLVARLRRTAWAGLGAAFAGALVWLVLETRDLAGDAAFGSIGTVLAGTLFGHFLAARIVVLLAASAAFARRWTGIAAALAGFALALQAGHSHAMAMSGFGALLGIAVLHLLAAGAWLGSLPALFVVVAGAPGETAAMAAWRYSRLGFGCVVVLLATSVAQFAAWIMNLPGLLGTAYGWIAMAKMAGFATLLGLAALNRLRLAPAMPDSRKALLRNIAVETMLGLAVVALAGVLTELPPSMHVQPLWPLRSIVSFDVLREDPDYRVEAARAVAMLVGGVILAVGGIVFLLRSRRAVPAASCLAGAVLAWFAIPHFGPLLVPAEPTLFYRSPTGFSAATIAQGGDLYVKNCAICHGAEGHGDGPRAKSLAVPPADLTAAHLWMHADGELYWWLSHGIEGPDGRLAMPAFPSLSDDDRWALIDYLHAHNAGLAMQDGVWTRPLMAPDFDISCPGSPGAPRALRLHGLRGKFVRIVFDGTAVPVAGVTTVMVGRNARPAPGICVADPDDAARAYAIALGTSGAAPASGTDILIDPSGHARLAGASSRWSGPDAIAAAVAKLSAAPAMAAPATEMAMPPGMKM